jgi:hypothetical protein
MDVIFVLVGVVAVWQFAGLIRDVWHLFRDRGDQQGE